MSRQGPETENEALITQRLASWIQQFLPGLFGLVRSDARGLPDIRLKPSGSLRRLRLLPPFFFHQAFHFFALFVQHAPAHVRAAQHTLILQGQEQR